MDIIKNKEDVQVIRAPDRKGIPRIMMTVRSRLKAGQDPGCTQSRQAQDTGIQERHFQEESEVYRLFDMLDYILQKFLVLVRG